MHATRFTHLYLNQRGFSHLLVPLVAIIGIAIIGTVMIRESRAASNPYSGTCTSTIIRTTTKVTTTKYKDCIFQAKELMDATEKEDYKDYKTATEHVSGTFAFDSKYYLTINDSYGTSTAYAVKALPGNGTNNALTNGTTNGTWQILCSDAVSAGLATGGKAANYTLTFAKNVSGEYSKYTNASTFKATCGSLPSSSGSGTTSGGTSGGGSTTTSDGCSVSGVVAPCIGSATTAASGYGKPVFDDEFNGTSLNKTYWTTNIEQGDSTENNVTVSPSNVAISGGDLILTLSSSSVGANVSTDPSQGMTGFQFGDGYYLEARIYFPGSGTNIYNWPALWTVNNNWPEDGEDDIAEGNVELTTNYHASGVNLNNVISGTWSNAWHTYALLRESGENYIYWDGKLVKQYATSDGGALHYITINVGNSNGSDCTCGGTSVYGSGSDVKVDYVRVWKKS